MSHSVSPTTWGEEEFSQHIRELSGVEEFHRLLRYRRGQISASVLERLKDEVARLIRADLHRAVALAEIAHRAARFCDDPQGVAVAHHACALAMHCTGRYQEAVRFYEQAEQIYSEAGREVEAARIARAKIDALMYLGRYDDALQTAAHARAVFRRHREDILLAQLELNVGNIYHRQDRYREALRYYQRAEATFAAHSDEFGLAHARFSMANQYTQLNEFEKALDLYQQARQGYERLAMPQLVNQTDYSIAWLHFLRGRFQKSLKLFTAVRARALEIGDSLLDALCDLDMAEVYLQLNTYEEALESARLAAEKFAAMRMTYEQAKAQMYMGIAYTHLNNFRAAEQALQEARRGFLLEGNAVYTALADIYLSDLLTHWHQWDQALRLCAEARKLFGEQNLSAKAAYAELQLARLKLFLGDLEEAGTLCRSALQLIGEAEVPWLKYQCLHLLGHSMQKAGHEREAYHHYRQAVEYLESLRSGIRLDEYKCSFLKDKLRVYEDLVELCLRAGTEEKAEEAFAYVEAAKSRSLVELLAMNRNIPGKVKDPSVERLYRQWNRLREELDWYYNRMNHYESRGPQRPVWLGVHLQDEVRQRERQLARLARRLSLEDAEYALLHTAPPSDARQVRRCLAADEVLIEYYLVDGRLTAFALSRDRMEVFNDITTVAATMPLLRRLKFYLDKFTLSESYIRTHQENIEFLTRRYLQKLYDALVRPMASWLAGKKIILVPHDFLHYVPFHALYDGDRYLIEQHEISYCPSASVYKLCLDKATAPRRGTGILIVGVPDEKAPFIEEEVAAVKSLWEEAEVLCGPEATLDNVRRRAASCRLIHLAAHGVFRRDNPMFSALRVGDGWLNFYDIFTLDLQADLVTLSACETGINEVFPGDELFGVMRGFLYAGAPSLLVSLWMVNDRSTADFMREFYTGVKEGLSKRAAVRRAQLRVKESYPHPYFWAPFILMGAS
jgi:tetratricopeptide (TPR) repeat protein